MAEKFDYKKVTTTINELEVMFDTFADKVRKLNEIVTENVNNGPTIYGEYGKALLNVWDTNASTFGDFKANFDDWVKMVTIVGINNKEFENNITGAINQLSREEFTKSNYGKFISNSNYASMVTDSNYRNSMRFDDIDSDIYDGEISNNGNLKRYTNKDGIVEKTVFYDENGKIKEYNTFAVTIAGTVNGITIYKSVCTNYKSDGNDGYINDTGNVINGNTLYECVLPNGTKYSSSDYESCVNKINNSNNNSSDSKVDKVETKSVGKNDSCVVNNVKCNFYGSDGSTNVYYDSDGYVFSFNDKGEKEYYQYVRGYNGTQPVYSKIIFSDIGKKEYQNIHGYNVQLNKNAKTPDGTNLDELSETGEIPLN